MRLRLFAACLMASSLAACGVALPPPAAIADTTTADERGALAIEVAYRTLGILIDGALDIGQLKGERASQIDALDAEISYWVGVARRAYDTGNSADYETAAGRAAVLIGQVRAKLGARP